MSARSLLLALALLALLAAGFHWIWLRMNAAALAADLRVLSVSPAAGRAVIADMRAQQELLVLAFAGIGLLAIAGGWFGLARWVHRPASVITRRPCASARTLIVGMNAEMLMLSAMPSDSGATLLLFTARASSSNAACGFPALRSPV